MHQMDTQTMHFKIHKQSPSNNDDENDSIAIYVHRVILLSQTVKIIAYVSAGSFGVIRPETVEMTKKRHKTSIVPYYKLTTFCPRYDLRHFFHAEI